MSALDAALLAAHAAQNTAALITLYTRAGDDAEARNDVARCGFYLTHAYVFALEAGAPQAPPLRARLKAMGRE